MCTQSTIGCLNTVAVEKNAVSSLQRLTAVIMRNEEFLKFVGNTLLCRHHCRQKPYNGTVCTPTVRFAFVKIQHRWKYIFILNLFVGSRCYFIFIRFTRRLSWKNNRKGTQLSKQLRAFKFTYTRPQGQINLKRGTLKSS